MEKIRILEVTDAFYPTIDGVVKVVDNYAEQLNKIAECAVVAPRASKKSGYKDEKSYRVIRCKSMRAPSGYRMATPLANRRVRKLLKNEQFDIMHVHSPFVLGKIAIKFAKKNNIPVVITLHTKYRQDFERELGRKNPLVKIMLKYILKAYNKADEVWTVSDEAKKVLYEYGYKGNVEVVKNATDYTYPQNTQQLIDRVNAEYNLEGQKNVFLFVGRMAMYKGLKLLCDALKIVKENNKDFKMLFVGGGFDLTKLKKYAEETGIVENCIFTGSVIDRETLSSYYLRSDMLVFPSTFDTSGVVKVEASAHKKPAVLIKNSCSGEGVEDGFNGYLVEENPQSLADKLISLCDDDSVKEVGEKAYQTLYRTWEEASQEVLEKYKRTIEKYKK